jgi:hypothetical protein
MEPDSTPVPATATGAFETGAAPPRGPKWTVMVFMGAESIEGNEPLDQAADDDLDEIESVGGSETLEIFVQVHRTGGVIKRHHFTTDKRIVTTDVQPVERGRALIDFIAEVIEKKDHQPGDHSILVLWGHAYDFAFGRFRTRSGVVDAIDFIELAGMLDQLQERYRTLYGEWDTRPPLDIIAFDACDVATVEMACQLKRFAKFMLGSEIGIPMPGWPYDRILGRLAKPLGSLMAPAEFGSWVVRRFCEAYPPTSPVSLSFLDLAKADDLRTRAEFLALALSIAIGTPDGREQVSDLFLRSQTADDRPYVDVADLCLSLTREIDDPMVVAGARALGDLLLKPRPPLVGTSAEGNRRPLIMDYGRNAGELARLNGISIYAPHVASNDFNQIRTLYDQFVFAKDTVWSGLVHALADEA